MIERDATSPPSSMAVLKVIYLLAVTLVVFAVPSVRVLRPWRWQIVAGIAAIQIVTLLLCRVDAAQVLRATARLKWFFAFLFLCYGLLPGGNGARNVHVWRLSINVAGIEIAGLMCLQILTVVLVSLVVRLTSRGTDLADGLARLGLPKLFVHAFDHTLGLLAGRPRRERGEGRGRDERGPGFVATLRRLMRGDVGFLVDSVRDNLERARTEVSQRAGGRLDQRMAHDVAVVSGLALVMASLKMLKFLPGVPFAPGIKGTVLLPLYVLASQRTYSRWGATSVGAIMGVVGFLQGDGRYGVLDILQHVAPGIVIDLAMPLVRRLPQNAVTYCALGFVATLTRTITLWLVVLLLGARAEVYLYPAVGMIAMVIAGTLSGFVTVYLLRAFPPAEDYSDDEQDDDVVRRTGRGV